MKENFLQPSLEQLYYMAELAGFAPSADNNQPWIFKIENSRIFVCHDDLSSVDSISLSLDFISIGAAIENIRLAATYFNFSTKTTFLSKENKDRRVAELTFSPNNLMAEPNFHFIKRRRTQRIPYSSKKLPKDFIDEIDTIFSNTPFSLIKIDSKSKLKKIGRYIKKLDSFRFGKRDLHSAFYKILHFKKEKYFKARYGLYFSDLQIPSFLKLFVYFLGFYPLCRLIDIMGLLPLAFHRSYQLTRKSKAIMLICHTHSNERVNLEAGILMQKLWLTAERHGVSLQPIGSLGVFLSDEFIDHCKKESESKKQSIVLHISKQIQHFFPHTKDQKILIGFRLGYGKGKLTSSVRKVPTNTIDVKKTTHGFDYKAAFSSNSGLLSDLEMTKLNQTNVAIPGQGGVGGIHMITLARLGIGGIHVADFDHFSITNFNRQYGAFVSTLGKSKVKTMKNYALDINPNLRLKVWEEAIDKTNVRSFLTGCDLMIDSIDAFAVSAKRLVYNTALEMGIPVIAAGPVGYGCALLIFLPGGPNFDDYFNYQVNDSKQTNFLRYMIGVTPRPYFLSYLDRTQVDMKNESGPSLCSSVQLCAGFATTEVIKIITGRGEINAAPYYNYFDPYLQKFKVHKLNKFHQHIVQPIVLKAVRKFSGL